MKKTSYETSKKLAEAGFKAETDFYWVKWNAGEPELVHEKEQTPALIEKVGAWDLETILEALPAKLTHGKLTSRPQISYDRNDFWKVYYPLSEYEVNGGSSESLADTAAKLWLKLKKEGLV